MVQISSTNLQVILTVDHLWCAYINHISQNIFENQRNSIWRGIIYVARCHSQTAEALKIGRESDDEYLWFDLSQCKYAHIYTLF